MTTELMELKDKDQQQHRDQHKFHQKTVQQGVDPSMLGPITLLLMLHRRHNGRVNDLVMVTVSNNQEEVAVPDNQEEVWDNQEEVAVSENQEEVWDNQERVPPWTVGSGKHYK